jgi:hypothetical protein
MVDPQSLGYITRPCRSHYQNCCDLMVHSRTSDDPYRSSSYSLHSERIAWSILITAVYRQQPQYNMLSALATSFPWINPVVTHALWPGYGTLYLSVVFGVESDHSSGFAETALEG